MDIVFVVLFRVLEAMFLVGVVGCAVAIPIVAYRMFSVLFERNDFDSPVSR